MTRAAHAEEIDLRLRDSARHLDKLTIGSDTHPFGPVLIGSGALSALANLSRQILDFERRDPIAKYRQRQAVAARIL
jgi:hypothetical protein